MDEEFSESASAIYAGDLHRLKELLAEDPTLAARVSSRSHPSLLQLVACEADQLPEPVAAARLLLEAGSATASPLLAAAGCGSRSILELLLDAGAPVDGESLWTPLDEALYWAQDSTVSLLVERGARIRALSTAAGLGDKAALASFFVGDELAPTAGPIASPFSEAEPLASDPQSILDHAFVMAAGCGQRQTAGRLLARGAAINARPPGYHWQGTALHAAVWRGHAGLVSWLLACGADPTIRDGAANSDAAGWARHHGHPELLALGL